ncbi:DUF1254 domain-containing protein [Aureimonas frigidaquae]|uniref:DUF1254 domain-containing protein n=1 Tax=Aureimonas frigidaquae TaxID=424757 RepID=UPI0007852146|nr:DUF1254 domain-containing protein [Aureimonas frigidaquae]
MRKRFISLGMALVVAEGALLAPAGAQQADPPKAVYDTSAFEYWHLNGETLKEGLPAQSKELDDAVRNYAYTLAVQATVWGTPAVTLYGLRYNDALREGANAKPNAFWRMEDVSTPELSEKSGYVSPNVNTVYGFGFMDLGPEPIILTVPNSNGRYYMVEILDMYTNAFAYAGGVATGYEGGTFALIGPGWKGDLPAGVKRIYSPTRWVMLQPRVHIKNPSDLEGARETLSAITVTGTSEYLGKEPLAPVDYDYPVPEYSDPKLPVSINSFKDPLQFWEILSNVINENPPPEAEVKALLPLFAPLGLELGKQWDRSKVNPLFLDAMKQAAEEISTKTLPAFPPGGLRNGWNWFWPSTGNFRTDYLNRALVTRWGLSGNTLEEAIYVGLFLDSENQPTMGENKYTITFLPPPFKEPGFWSFTMYDASNLYTVPNPLNRYTLGSDNDLITNDDGTVTLYLQHESPGKDKEANWLPTPASGRFLSGIRAYAPDQQLIEGVYDRAIYDLPPAIKVE